MEPRVRVEVLECRPETDAGHWRVTWRIHNVGPAPLDLLTAWVPHGRFRGERRQPVSAHLAAGDSTLLEFRVAAAEEPGTRVDNAFLILQTSTEGRTWRVFTRMRIEFDVHGGAPRPIVEAITTQTMGSQGSARQS